MEGYIGDHLVTAAVVVIIAGDGGVCAARVTGCVVTVITRCHSTGYRGASRQNAGHGVSVMEKTHLLVHNVLQSQMP
jgi:hypothetical protein